MIIYARIEAYKSKTPSQFTRARITWVLCAGAGVRKFSGGYAVWLRGGVGRDLVLSEGEMDAWIQIRYDDWNLFMAQQSNAVAVHASRGDAP